MGVIIRQSFKSTFVLYIGIIIGVINRLFLLPHFLTLQQLGFLDIFFAISMIFSKLSTLGIIGSITKYFSYFQKKKTIQYFNGLNITIALFGYIIISLLFIIFKDFIIHNFPKNIDLISKYYNYTFFLAAFIMFREIFTTYSLNKLRLTVPSILNDTIQRLSTLVLLLLIGYNIISFDKYVLIYSLTYGVIALLLFIYIKKILAFKVSFKINNISKKDIKKTSTYSLFMLLAALASLVSQYTDSLMLASYKGLDTAAIYSIAFFIGVSIEMPKRAITSITGAVIAEHWNNNNKDQIKHLYKISSINQGILGCFLFLLVFINLDEIFYILPKSEVLSQSKNIVIIIGLSKIIDMITGVNAEILRTSKYYKIDFIIICCFIWISIVLNTILIPNLGMEGAAYSTLISVFLYNSARYFVLKKIFKLEPFSLNTLKLFGIFFLLISIYIILPSREYNSILSAISLIAVKSLIFGIISVFLLYKFTVSVEMNNILDKLHTKFINKIN